MGKVIDFLERVTGSWIHRLMPNKGSGFEPGVLIHKGNHIPNDMSLNFLFPDGQHKMITAVSDEELSCNENEERCPNCFGTSPNFPDEFSCGRCHQTGKVITIGQQPHHIS